MKKCSLYGLILHLISGSETITLALRWIASRLDSQITQNYTTDSMDSLKNENKSGGVVRGVEVEWEAHTGICQCSISTFENS